MKIKDCDKEYGKVLHFIGRSGLALSKIPTMLLNEEVGQERNDIYEPVYFGHYESIGSPTETRRFAWLMGDPDFRGSIKSLNNAVYLSNKPKIKVKKKKIGRFDSFGSLM